MTFQGPTTAKRLIADGSLSGDGARAAAFERLSIRRCGTVERRKMWLAR